MGIENFNAQNEPNQNENNKENTETDGTPKTESPEALKSDIISYLEVLLHHQEAYNDPKKFIHKLSALLPGHKTRLAELDNEIVGEHTSPLKGMLKSIGEKYPHTIEEIKDLLEKLKA